MFNYRYIATKPITFENMGTHRWHWVEAPVNKVPAMMPGAPTSKHKYGVIATEHMVLQDQCQQAGLISIRS
jgi:predicted ATP-grasp superfamily ATP-dependent carboligase